MLVPRNVYMCVRVLCVRARVCTHYSTRGKAREQPVGRELVLYHVGTELGSVLKEGLYLLSHTHCPHLNALKCELTTLSSLKHSMGYVILICNHGWCPRLEINLSVMRSSLLSQFPRQVWVPCSPSSLHLQLLSHQKPATPGPSPPSPTVLAGALLSATLQTSS